MMNRATLLRVDPGAVPPRPGAFATTPAPSPARSRGYSLLEIIVVIGVIGLMVAAIAWGINKAFGSNDIKDETAAVTQVVAVLPEMRSSSGYGADLESLMSQLIARHELPAVWRVNAGGTSATNSWDGNLLVRSYDGQSVVITSSNIPRDACNKLVIKLSRNAGIRSQTINLGTTTYVGEVTAAQAKTECATNANRLDWYTVR